MARACALWTVWIPSTMTRSEVVSGNTTRAPAAIARRPQAELGGGLPVASNTLGECKYRLVENASRIPLVRVRAMEDPKAARAVTVANLSPSLEDQLLSSDSDQWSIWMDGRLGCFLIEYGDETTTGTTIRRHIALSAS